MYPAKAAGQHLANMVLESDRARGTMHALVAMDSAAAAAGTAAATAAGCACDHHDSCSCCSRQHGARAPLYASRCTAPDCRHVEGTCLSRTLIPSTVQRWDASEVEACK